VTVSTETLEVAQGRQASYTVRLNTEPVGGNVTVRLARFMPVSTVSTGTFSYAINSLTFTASGGASPWYVPQSVTVRGLDEYGDRDAGIRHTVTGADYAGVSAADVYIQVTATTSKPTFTIAATTADADGVASGHQINEADGTVVFTVTAGGDALTGAATVDWAVSGQVTGADYSTADTSPLNFGAGEASKTITLTLTADNLNEAAESLTVTLSNASRRGSR